MQLKYKNEQIELARDDSALTTIFEKVSNLINKEDTIFSHLVIDDVEVYSNHEEYIKDRLNEIMLIEIITKSKNEMIWETMESMHQYLQRAVPALKGLVDKSYNDFSEEVWEGIGQLAEGMQWMLQFKTFISQAVQQPAKWETFVEHFETCEEQFAELLEAIETQDMILISDLLAYEITPSYEKLQAKITEILADENYFKLN